MSNQLCYFSFRSYFVLKIYNPDKKFFHYRLDIICSHIAKIDFNDLF